MSFFSSLFLTLFQHPTSKFELTSSVIILIIIVIRFYRRVSRYPRGPCPWPIIGNLTYLNTLTSSVNPHNKLVQLYLKYGSVFTVWMSYKPLVFISDPNLVSEAFQKPECCNRGFIFIGKAKTMNQGVDLGFNNYHHVYVDHRKLLLSAIRKYVTTDELNKMTSECVDEFWNEITNQGLEKPIDIPTYFHSIVAKIMTRSLYGSNYKLNDPELMCLISALKKFPRLCDLMTIFDGLPNSVAELFLNLLLKTSYLGIPEIKRVMSAKYHQHLDSYKNGRIRDVVDALISAKEESVLEDRESAEHLNDVNLVNILGDFCIGGIDTSHLMFEWIFLLMIKHPEMQSKMQLEIQNVIENRLPKQEDRKDCHFTVAFINETMRLRPIGPIAASHQIKINVKIGGHKIPSQTIVVNYLYSIHQNVKFWQQPDQFDPTRFLDVDGKLKTSKHPAFMPFSIGRRSCPGEKLAQLNLFLVVARMLQLTNQMGLQFTGDGPIDVELDPKNIFFLKPLNYRLMLKRRPHQ